MAGESVENAEFNSRLVPVNIKFEDISYAVPVGRKGSQVIINSISGQFNAGQLTAILGPSGSGKTSLLNVLSGYGFQHTSGTISINDIPRDLGNFRKISRYIMQEIYIQPSITLEEAMMFAASLKLGLDMPAKERQKAVTETIESLGLGQVKDTRTEKLSGGERRRLFIALELLNNPSVLFLDEPTTGLDNVSTSQCIDLLKQLATDGRTIVCSIHAPSAKVFSSFDNVYVLSFGKCVYQGYGGDLLPYLSTLELTCPIQYNPADFILEICSGDYGDYHDKMVAAIENGKKAIASQKITAEIPQAYYPNKHICSEWQQFQILFWRMWLLAFRSKKYQLLKIVSTVSLGILTGVVYKNVGSNPSKQLEFFTFYLSCVSFPMYVSLMPTLIWFPLEIKYLKREYLNQWYGLKAYFGALTVVSIQIQIIFIALFVPWPYIMTSQPIEIDRIACFYGMCLMTSIISESCGILITSAMSMTNSSVIGPLLLSPALILGFWGMGEHHTNINLLFKIIMRTSYLRLAFEIVALTMMSNRTIKCSETDDCFDINLGSMISQMAMGDAVVWADLLGLFVIWAILSTVSMYFLRQRLVPNRMFMVIKQAVRRNKNRF